MKALAVLHFLAVVQKAGQPDAACTTKSPDGRPCVARVQRYYMQQKQKG
jgi:hypothetical protein